MGAEYCRWGLNFLCEGSDLPGNYDLCERGKFDMDKRQYGSLLALLTCKSRPVPGLIA